jgi:hypothetical protein
LIEVLPSVQRPLLTRAALPHPSSRTGSTSPPRSSARSRRASPTRSPASTASRTTSRPSPRARSSGSKAGSCSLRHASPPAPTAPLPVAASTARRLDSSTRPHFVNLSLPRIRNPIQSPLWHNPPGSGILLDSADAFLLGSIVAQGHKLDSQAKCGADREGGLGATRGGGQQRGVGGEASGLALSKEARL